MAETLVFRGELHFGADQIPAATAIKVSYANSVAEREKPRRFALTFVFQRFIFAGRNAFDAPATASPTPCPRRNEMPARKVNPRWVNSIALDVEPLIQIAQWHASNLVAEAKTLLANGAPPAEVQSLTSQAVAAANGSAAACLRLYKLFEAATAAAGDPDDRDPSGSADALRRLQAAARKWAAFSDAAGAAAGEALAVERESVRVQNMSGILAANPNLSFAAGRTFSARLLLEGDTQPETIDLDNETDAVDVVAESDDDEGASVGEVAGADAGEDDAVEAAAPPPEEPIPAPAAARKSRSPVQKAPPSDEIDRAAALIRQVLQLPTPKYVSKHVDSSPADSALSKLELARVKKAFPLEAGDGRPATNLKTLKTQIEKNIPALEAYLESDSVKKRASALAKAISKASVDNTTKTEALTAAKTLAAADLAYLKAKLAELKDKLAATNAELEAPKATGRAKGPKAKTPAPAAAPAEAVEPPAAEAVAEEPEDAPPVDAAAIAKDLAAGTATTTVRRRKVSAQVGGGVSRGVVEK